MQTPRIGIWMKRIAWAPLLLLFGCASFELTSEPPSNIYKNDRKIATTPYSFSLMSEGLALTLKRDGYVDKEVFISPLDQKSIHFNLEKVGVTLIDTLPHGATVLRAEDESELGISPCSLHLSAPETVLIQMKGFEPEEMDITPNKRYLVELKPINGFKLAFYRDIAFSSEPSSVEIYDRLAAERLGITPVQLIIEAGTDIEYRKPGYQSRSMTISKRAPHRIHIKLDPLAQVTLTSLPETEVYLPGGVTPLGTVPFTVEVKTGTFFELRKEGYYNSTVAVAPSSPKNLPVELRKIPYKTILTDPPGAAIYRLGGREKLGNSPFTTIVDTERVFEIKKKGFTDKIIGVGSDSPAEIKVSLSTDSAALGSLESAVISTY